MAKKIYRTKRNIIHYSCGLLVRGRKVFVTFEGGVQHPRLIPSTFSTDDVGIQDALEAWGSFNKDFELVYTEPVATPKKKKPVEDEKPALKKIHQVTTVPQAISNLIRNGYLGSTEELVDVESVQAAAETLGIVYTKLS
jgi:hypothetical protein